MTLKRVSVIFRAQSFQRSDERLLPFKCAQNHLRAFPIPAQVLQICTVVLLSTKDDGDPKDEINHG